MRTGLVTVQALPGQTDEAAKNAEEIAWRPATSQMINKSRGDARLLTGSEFLHIGILAAPSPGSGSVQKYR